MQHDQESGQPGGEVIDFAEKKEALGAAAPRVGIEKKTYQVPIMHNIKAVVDAILGIPGTLPPFPHKFYVSNDHKGDTVTYMEDNNQVVSILSDNGAINLISKYCQEDLKFRPGIDKINYQHSAMSFKMWRARGAQLPHVADVRQLSEPGLTYSRLPFDFIEDKNCDHCPLFKELMDRTENSLAMRIWIGSLFDPNSYMQQYLWVYGRGHDGKSVLADVIYNAFTKSGGFSTGTPNMNDKFWSFNLVNKRFVLFPDSNNSTFITSGTFKSLTGGDVVSVEIKNGPCFTVTLRAKYMFLSNKKPSIDSNEADQRRIIYCAVDPRTEKTTDPEYKKRLAQEAPYIFGHCFGEYLENCAPGMPVPTDRSISMNLAESNERKFRDAFEEFFEIPDDEETRINSHCLPIQFDEMFLKFKIKDSDRDKFYEFIDRIYEVKRVSFNYYEERKGERKRTSRKVYRGLIRRPTTDLTCTIESDGYSL